MDLREINENYKNGFLTRREATEQVYPVLETLFSLNDFLPSSVIEKIEITEENIVFTISVKTGTIKLCAEKGGLLSITSTLLGTNRIEEDMEDSIEALVKDKDVIFDIGANVGWYTINFAKLYPAAKIYSFEPIPTTYNYLVQNMILNNLNPKNAHNLGFFNENKDIGFYYSPECTESSSIKDLQYTKSKAEKITCKVVTIDEFCQKNNISHIDFIKCDVEGAELFVYQGAIEMLRQSRPIVASEMLRKWSAKFDYHPNDIIEFFAKLRYECIALNRNGNKRIITEVGDSTVETNYLFIPFERRDEVHSSLVNLEL